MKARRYNLAPRGFMIYLRTQDFRSEGMEIRLAHKTAIPNALISEARSAFAEQPPALSLLLVRFQIYLPEPR